MDATQKLTRAYRAILLLAVLVVGLGALAFALARHGGAFGERENEALFDPEVRREAVRELVLRGGGEWDTFPDAAVGRMLQPGLIGEPSIPAAPASNDVGLRERNFSLPKAPGTTRVVLLGDSFVMGGGVATEDRLGVFLDALLHRNAKAGHGSIEVLHFGLGAWNIVAECAFLRRQLALAQPDLVVQIVVRNDLEDNPGARGMGTLSTWSPRRPERADSLFTADSPRSAFQTRSNTWLSFGLDWESRSRFEESAREIERLARAVEQQGGRYLLLDHFAGLLGLAQRELASRLRPEQSLPLPSSFRDDDRMRVSAQDRHWSRAGHERVANYLYGAICARGLLPALELAHVPEADHVLGELLPLAESEVADEADPHGTPGRRKLAAEIDFRKLDDDSAAQVHGGVIRGGIVSSYASLLLRCDGRARLTVAGSGLGRPEIDGVQVTVFVEATPVGTLAPAGAAPFEQTFELPAEVAAQPFVSVRFQSDDFAYALPDLRACQVFRLERVALAK